MYNTHLIYSLSEKKELEVKKMFEEIMTEKISKLETVNPHKGGLMSPSQET